MSFLNNLKEQFSNAKARCQFTPDGFKYTKKACASDEFYESARIRTNLKERAKGQAIVAAANAALKGE